MNRGERRRTTIRKWVSRARKIYYSYNAWYIPKNGLKSDTPRGPFLNYFKKCESITDFLNEHKYAKILKKCTVLHKNISEKMDYKIQNRKQRYSIKNQIRNDIIEYNNNSNYLDSD